jgi:Fe-S-cluster containining protein
VSQLACARCPKALTASCCEVKPHERLATITWSDVERLRAATGLELDDFAEWEWLDADHVQAWLHVNPVYRGYLGPSPRRLTLKAVGGACVFLDRKSGCTLSRDARPTPCRIYPFEPGGRLSVDRFDALEQARANVVKGTAHACLAVQESGSFEELRRALDTSEEEVQLLADRLRTEIRAHAKTERAAALSAPLRPARRR